MKTRKETIHRLRFGPVALSVALASGCNFTDRVSVDSSGNEGNGDSRRKSSISADGRYVAFGSDASNLVAGDTNGRFDVFVHDTQTGTTARVNPDSSGDVGPLSGTEPSISADGRYVAFGSLASNLVPGDTNNRVDIFLHDTQTITTIRVNVDSSGNESNSSSTDPSISANGRYVAFESGASDLVAGDTNNADDIFVHDTQTGTTTRVSVDSAGNEGNSWSIYPSISADGRYVAFWSKATNLVAGDSNGGFDVFVHDTQTGTTTRVSVDSSGNESNGLSIDTSISADGRHVAFRSNASNLVAGDTNNADDVFVHDTQTGTTTRVSLDSSGNEGNSTSRDPSLSADGRYVAFRSSASNLVAGDTNNTDDIFVHDTQTGSTRRVSVDAFGVEANDASIQPQISADGRYVAYNTLATNLVPDDTNGSQDVVIRSVPVLTVTSVIPDHLPIGATTSVTITGTDFLAGATPEIGGGIISNVVILDESTITMDVEIPSNRPSGARNLVVNLFGTGPGEFTGSAAICENCVTFQ